MDLLKYRLQLDAIKDAIQSLGQVPSGNLYATVSGHIDLDTYNSILEDLRRQGVIQVRGHLLTFIRKTMGGHPFVATPNHGKCSSCGRSRVDGIHATDLQRRSV